MSAWDTTFEKKLLSAKNYREFVRLFFDKDRNWKSPRRLTFEEFALRAGFASKGFINDVVAERKGLTMESLPRVQEGLRLKSHWRDYFRYLVACDEVRFQSARQDEAYFKKQLAELRKKILLKKSTQAFKGGSEIERTLMQQDFPTIFAALGDMTSGASMNEIVSRTGLTEDKIQRVLQALKEAGVVNNISDATGARWCAVANSLVGLQMRSSESFQLDFLRSIDRAKRRLSRQAKSDRALFMTQTFSVSSERLAEFRSRLSEIVSDFSDDAECNTGDTVAEICLSFTHTYAGEG